MKKIKKVVIKLFYWLSVKGLIWLAKFIWEHFS